MVGKRRFLAAPFVFLLWLFHNVLKFCCFDALLTHRNSPRPSPYLSFVENTEDALDDDICFPDATTPLCLRQHSSYDSDWGSDLQLPEGPLTLPVAQRISLTAHRSLCQGSVQEAGWDDIELPDSGLLAQVPSSHEESSDWAETWSDDSDHITPSEAATPVTLRPATFISLSRIQPLRVSEEDEDGAGLAEVGGPAAVDTCPVQDDDWSDFDVAHAHITQHQLQAFHLRRSGATSESPPRSASRARALASQREQHEQHEQHDHDGDWGDWGEEDDVLDAASQQRAMSPTSVRSVCSDSGDDDVLGPGLRPAPGPGQAPHSRADPLMRGGLSSISARVARIRDVGRGRRGPTLIANLNSSLQPKVVGTMRFDPDRMTWVGNDEALVTFRRRRPALIRNINRSKVPIRLGGMTYDPVQMRWIGNEEEVAAFSFASTPLSPSSCDSLPPSSPTSLASSSLSTATTLAATSPSSVRRRLPAHACRLVPPPSLPLCGGGGSGGAPTSSTPHAGPGLAGTVQPQPTATATATARASSPPPLSVRSPTARALTPRTAPPTTPPRTHTVAAGKRRSWRGLFGWRQPDDGDAKAHLYQPPPTLASASVQRW